MHKEDSGMVGISLGAGATSPSPIAVRVQVNRQMSDKSTMSFETWFDQMTPLEVMNDVTDRLNEVADRQSRKYELLDLENYEKRIAREIGSLEDQLASIYKEANSKVVEGRRLPIQDKSKKAIIDQITTNIANQKKHLQVVRGDIEERRTKI